MYHLINNSEIFVIVPVYNEGIIVKTTVLELLNKGYKTIIVDDGSDFKVHHTLKGLPVYLITHPINLGQGAALQTGIKFALEKNAKYIITFDADGQHRVSDISLLIDTLINSNADIVLGSRFLLSNNNIPIKRKLLLHVGRYFNFIATGVMLTDAHNGLRAIKNHAANKICIRQNRMAHATEFLSQIKKHNLKFIEAPVHILYTNYSLKKGQNLFSSFRIVFDTLLNKIFE